MRGGWQVRKLLGRGRSRLALAGRGWTGLRREQQLRGL